MFRNKVLVALVLLIGFGLLGVGVLYAVRVEDQRLDPVSVPTPRASDVLEWACPSGTVGQVTCGYVEVPADYDDPDGDRIRVFVASVDVPLERSGPPLLFLGERLGPGSVTDFADWRQIGRDLGREIILVDHRGTGRSDPQVNCLDLGKVSWLSIDLGNTERLTAARVERREAIDRCLTRLRQLPLEPDFSFGNLVLDLAEVRSAFSIDEWLIVGSGDTVPLAVALEHHEPEAAEALVLLRAAPIVEDGAQQRSDYGREVLAAALGCGSESCRDTTLATIASTAAGLGQRSLVFSTEVGDARQQVSVNAGTIFPTLALGVVEQANRDVLPGLIERMEAGQWRGLATLRGERFRTHDHPALAVKLAAGCTVAQGRLIEPEPETVEEDEAADEDGIAEEDETVGLDEDADETEAADGRWLGLLDDPVLDDALCDPIDTAAEAMDSAPNAEVLVVNQAFDYLAPRSAAEDLGRGWPAASIEVFEHGGAPTLTDPCVLSTVGEFLGLPTRLETGCQ